MSSCTSVAVNKGGYQQFSSCPERGMGCSKPFGMSDTDLILYDKELYAMYRTNQGLEKDGFAYDPIVSNGMLASDYALSEGLAWAYLLTPNAQDNIFPGDNRHVPVDTYTNYEQNQPTEKYMNGELGYSGSTIDMQAQMMAANRNMGNAFCGDFTNYFDQESGMIPAIQNKKLAAKKQYNPAPLNAGTKVPVKSGSATAAAPKKPVAPGRPRPSVKSIGFPLANIFKPKPKGGGTNGRLMSPDAIAAYAQREGGDQSGTFADCVGFHDYQSCADAWMAHGLVVPTHGQGYYYEFSMPGSGDTGGTSSGAPDTSGGMSGGGSGGSGGGGVAAGDSTEQPGGGEQGPPAEGGEAGREGDAKAAEQKMNWIPVAIGAVLVALILYAWAKSKQKDTKKFAFVGLLIGAALGFAYAKHQVKPIEQLSKIGVKSKAESSYCCGSGI